MINVMKKLIGVKDHGVRLTDVHLLDLEEMKRDLDEVDDCRKKIKEKIELAYKTLDKLDKLEMVLINRFS